MKKELNNWFKKIGIKTSYSNMLKNGIMDIEIRHLTEFNAIPDVFFKSHFTNVKFIDCSFHEIVLKEWEALQNLDLSDCRISKIHNINLLSNLECLELQGNYLKSLFEINHKNIKELYLNSNDIIDLKINCPNIKILECENNLNLRSVVVMKNSLENLMLENGKIETIDLKKCKRLKFLWINGNNLKKIKCESKKLIELVANNCNLESVDVDFTSLKILKLMGNQIKEFKFNRMKKITLSLNCDSLKIIANSELHKFLVMNNVKKFQVFENTHISDFL